MYDNFMWENQQKFQESINVKARELFNKIDPDLQPEVFLLGILMDKRDDKHPIYLEPEDCGYKVSDFTSLHDLAIELDKLPSETELLYYRIYGQANRDNRLKIEAYREALQQYLSRKKPPFIDNTEVYISYPTSVDNFLIFVVLTLREDTLNKYYSLVSEKGKLFKYIKVDRSLIESIIRVYLNECSEALKDPEQDIDVIYRNSNELIREAGEKFMRTVADAGKNSKYLNFDVLYNACNMISSLKYEGEEGLGKIVIAEKNHPNIKSTLQLKEPIEIKEFRKVRKFLQLAKEDSLIISDAALIYGLGEIRGNYNPRDESLFIINFVSHYKWELLHDNQSMMIVEYEQPRLPKSSLVRDKFYSDLRRIFRGIEDTELSDLYDITIEATKQKHGTMLVITDTAKEESERLGQQCFPLTPLRLNTSIVQQITSIDGSVLIDSKATCYAVGVILDGNATNKGDASRGARYNSAIRYYEQYGKNKSTVLVIISEDGMIDIIPNLKPQIKHSEITQKIDNLQALSEENKINRKNFSKLVNFFRKMEFYLSSSECEQINKIGKKFDEKTKSKDPYAIRVIYPDLKPNEDMNETYYLDE